MRVGETFWLGRPWLEGSTADRLIATPAYSLPAEFEICAVGDLRITYRWLIPITREESVYACEQGFSALEDLFEQSGADLLDPRRSSLVRFEGGPD